MYVFKYTHMKNTYIIIKYIQMTLFLLIRNCRITRHTNKNKILLFSIKYSYISQIYRKCKAELNKRQESIFNRES